MKTERQFGYDYAEWMHNTEKYSEPVDVNVMCNTTSPIPDGDYTEMKGVGIENPDPREYWKGYNEFMAAIGKNPAASAFGRLGGSVKSAAKTAAARENAKKGGWPKGRKRKAD